MQKLAILGGTFNPVHWGHLLIAETALDQQKLDQVIWVPAHHPPHRSSINLADAVDRVEMIKQAIANNPAFTLATVDLERSGTSYAINTLTDLQTLYPNSQWYWIIGLDAFQSLPRWYRRQDLAPQCCWLVVPRLTETDASKQQVDENTPGDRETLFALQSNTSKTPTSGDTPQGGTLQALPSFQLRCKEIIQQMAAQGIHLNWRVLQMPLIEISSSLIRQYCSDRRSIRYLVPDPVLTYIKTHNLYI